MRSYTFSDPYFPLLDRADKRHLIRADDMLGSVKNFVSSFKVKYSLPSVIAAYSERGLRQILSSMRGACQTHNCRAPYPLL